MWYTSLAGGSYKALIAAFEAKYPGVRVDVYRAGGADLYVRITEEYKAGRNLVDTIETTEGNLMFMRDSRLLQPYNSPVLKAYPDDAKEAAEILARGNDELERLVEERTAALMVEVEERRRVEESMRQGEKMQAIGQLTGGIAHDFNNVLQVVSTGIAILRVPSATPGSVLPDA